MTTIIPLRNWYKCKCFVSSFEPDCNKLSSFEPNSNLVNFNLLTLTIQGGTEDKPLLGSTSRIVPWSKFRTYIRRVIIRGKIVFDQKHRDLSGLFRYCNKLEEIIGLENLDTSNIVNMSYMFSGCNKLTELNLLNWNTSNVTNMAYMFDSCKSLTELDLSNFNTKNVTDMSWMFNNCSHLTEIDTSNFNTSKVQEMRGMFAYCNNLVVLDLFYFNLVRTFDMSWMFKNCVRLNEIRLPKCNTLSYCTKVEMFNGCSSLKSVDLSTFYFAPFEVKGLFSKANQLESVKFPSNYNISPYLKQMFRVVKYN